MGGRRWKDRRATLRKLLPDPRVRLACVARKSLLTNTRFRMSKIEASWGCAAPIQEPVLLLQIAKWHLPVAFKFDPPNTALLFA